MNRLPNSRIGASPEPDLRERLRATPYGTAADLFMSAVLGAIWFLVSIGTPGERAALGAVVFLAFSLGSFAAWLANAVPFLHRRWVLRMVLFGMPATAGGLSVGLRFLA